MNTSRLPEPKPQPPRWAQQLLRRLHPTETLEEVEGDLDELYVYWYRKAGKTQATLRYLLNVVSVLPPFVRRRERKSSEFPTPTNTTMIRNYLKIAFRNLVKNKAYSFINIGGLAVGMAVAMLIGLWIYDELSFNTYHEHYSRIAQVRSFEYGEQGVGVNSSLQYPLLLELKNNYKAHFKHIVAASWDVDNVLSTPGKQLSRNGLFMEADAPEMLTLKMVYGSRAGLKDPHSILLSASTANALFGDTDPVNQAIKINNKLDVKVTGVYEDLPLNTQFNQIKFLAPFDLWVADNPWIREQAMTDWQNHFLKIYAEIAPNTDFETVSATVKNAEMKNLVNFPKEAKRKAEVFLLPMSDWHLHNYKRGVVDTGPMQQIRLIGTIGAFVLLLACINFMNLSTARSEKRAKEVGVRKSMGSVRRQLVNQFFSESYLVVMLAFVLALVLVMLSLPWFNDVSAKQIAVPWLNHWFWLASVGFIGLTGLLAGSYPALYLSSFQAVNVLKGTFRVGRFASMPRKILVVVQFTVSVVLIVGTIIVYRQIQFAKNRPVGYTRDGLLLVAMKSGDFYGKHDLLRSQLQQTGVVSDMAESTGKVTEVWSGNGGFTWNGKDPTFNDSFGTLVVSPEFGKTVGWQFLKGRDFSRQFVSDSSGIVINEAAAHYMGLKNPIGEAISWKFQEQPLKNYTILGVIKNMVMESPYDPIFPTIFMIRGHTGTNYIHVKINPAVSVREALPKIEAVFKKLIPTAPFEYKFADQEYARKFAAEERIGNLAAIAAVLAIFISCLGLFGLASFMAEQRTKEIGIRKVLGASVSNLWALLSKDFVKLVIIAFGIATPISYYFLNDWLQKYTYRTELSWWIFALSGAGALMITLLTVSFQSIKAALMDPVKSLRSE
ncbi:ABC transporter permease [Spirosoma radiotolerans]|uniref:ABC transporter permease n=1 Tax=Spirosoma radiotolerans TaxID=1379870 RepID=A0A0E3ZUJ5_9BACT|nr:ABC transporter permease [Spirosoma radiotolerans]AKD54584.1 ABC transporter permease [Spirosoma radiotolerans]